jgi:shikimate kinase
MSSRVLLIGPRGCGKSTVGPILADRLAVAFVDADDAIEHETGRSIRELFERDEFRDAEAAVLARLLRGPPAVVAAGGGAVLWSGLAGAAQDWRVVWLDADPAVLARRIAGDDRDRPSLTGADPADEIAEVVREREPLYRAVAWKRVETDRDDSETVAERIAGLLRTDA